MSALFAASTAPGPFVPPGLSTNGGSTGGGGTNEPSGMTLITERGFASVDEDGWSDEDTDADWSLVTDQTDAPQSPNTAGRIRFPAGFSGGGDPARSIGPSFSASEIYLYFALKMDSDWEGHPDSGVNKLFFITDSSQQGGGDPVYLDAHGRNAEDLNFEVRLQGSLDGSRNLGRNVGSSGDDVVARGVYKEIECHLVGNTPGTADGEVHVWIDGTKTHEYTDVGFFESGSDGEFDSLRWEPIWGGINETVSSTMYQWMDHIYMSKA